MEKDVNLDALRALLRAFAVAVTLLLSCISLATAQEPGSDQIEKTIGSASVEKTDNVEKPYKIEKLSALPNTIKNSESPVAKFKPFLEASDKSKSAKPFTEDVNSASSAPGKQTTGDSDWHFAFAPYLYLSGLQGQVGARNRTLDIDLSLGDVLSDFKFGFMGTTELRKKRLIILNDIIWISLSQEHSDPPPSLFAETQIKVKTFIWGPEVGYRLVDHERGTFDIRGGFRLMSIKNELTTTTGILQGFNVSGRKTWATPIVGVFGNFNVTEKFFLSGRFDIGGGWGADFTSQVYLGGGFKLRPNIALITGWRYLTTDYKDNDGFVFDTTMKGMIVGMKFQIK